MALGAAVSPPLLLKDVADFLKGKELTPEVIKKASEKAITNVWLVKDFRTSQEHLESTVKTLVKRALEDCIK